MPSAAAPVAAVAVASCPAAERSAVERSSNGPDAVEEPDASLVAVADEPYGDEFAVAVAEAGVDVRASSH